MPARSRLALGVLLCVALLAPKLGTALSLLKPGGVQTIVICSASGMTTITLGPDGTPLSEVEINEEPCTMGVAVVAEARPPAFWQVLARRIDQWAALHAHSDPTRPLYDRRRPARAPPSLFV